MSEKRIDSIEVCTAPGKSRSIELGGAVGNAVLSICENSDGWYEVKQQCSIGDSANGVRIVAFNAQYVISVRYEAEMIR